MEPPGIVGVAYGLDSNLLAFCRGDTMKIHPDLKLGRPFPNFVLPDQDGEVLKLSQRMRGWPSIVVFYRGVW